MDGFATVTKEKLHLKKKDKAMEDPKVKQLQKVIDSSMPFIRVEDLLIEVDRLTRFTQHFKPIATHSQRPKQFYRTLLAAIISQATNLGVISMSASMKNTSVDMLRHVLHYFIREETLEAANAHIVNKHHLLPLSSVYGKGNISSSNTQRFGIRASSLLASYYPRYYGYYEKAIGIYTHVSDQYSVLVLKLFLVVPGKPYMCWMGYWKIIQFYQLNIIRSIHMDSLRSSLHYVIYWAIISCPELET